MENLLLSEKQKLEQEIEEQSQLRTLKARTCERCGEATFIYLCQYHRQTFCKPCLMETHEMKTGENTSSTLFSAKCNTSNDKFHIDCIYNPLGLASETF